MRKASIVFESQNSKSKRSSDHELSRFNTTKTFLPEGNTTIEMRKTIQSL